MRHLRAWRSIGSTAGSRPVALTLALVALAGMPSAGATARSIHRPHARTAHARLERLELAESGADSLLTLALSAPVHPRLLRLHRPERIVIDLPHTERRAALPIWSADSPIAALRSGVLGNGDLRLVLELASAAAPAVTLQGLDHQREWHVLLSGVMTAASHPTAALPPADGGHGPATQNLADKAADAAPLRGIATAHAPRGAHDVIVVVDPGHGGVDPGAIGRDGTHEKDVTLAIARALAARIDREPGMRAVLTRDGDYFIALSERLERARRAHADFFVSIHADSVRDPQISGASVYVLSERGASSEAARHLAEEENAADLRGGITLAAQKADLRSVLLDISQSEYIGQSAEAAERVLGSLSGVGSVRKREVQRAAFVVLKSPFIPSMLVETAYISNRVDEERLESPVEQQRLAEAIFHGIANYFRQYPPPGSLFAHARESAAPASS